MPGRQAAAKSHQHLTFGGLQMDHLVCQKVSKAIAVSHIVCSLLDFILQGLIHVVLPHIGLSALNYSISQKE